MGGIRSIHDDIIQITDDYTVQPTDCRIEVDTATAGKQITITLLTKASYLATHLNIIDVSRAAKTYPVKVVCNNKDNFDEGVSSIRYLHHNGARLIIVPSTVSNRWLTWYNNPEPPGASGDISARSNGSLDDNGRYKYISQLVAATAADSAYPHLGIGGAQSTSIALNNQTYVQSVADQHYMSAGSPGMLALVRLHATGDRRCWVGCARGGVGHYLADTPTANKDILGFRYSTNVPDTNWKAIGFDGTSITVVDTGIAADTTPKLFEATPITGDIGLLRIYDQNKVCLWEGEMDRNNGQYPPDVDKQLHAWASLENLAAGTARTYTVWWLRMDYDL